MKVAIPMNSARSELHSDAPKRGARGRGDGMAPAAGADAPEDPRVKRLRIRSAASKRAAASVKRMKISRSSSPCDNSRKNIKT